MIQTPHEWRRNLPSPIQSHMYCDTTMYHMMTLTFTTDFPSYTTWNFGGAGGGAWIAGEPYYRFLG
jgi:hypothetical protein